MSPARRVTAGLCGAVALVAASVRAQESRGLDLLRLASVLGEAHALRQACAPDDQTWRARMRRLIAIEAPDAAQEAALVDSFNSGFLKARARARACDAALRADEAATAARGRDLARRLSGVPAPPSASPEGLRR